MKTLILILILLFTTSFNTQKSQSDILEYNLYLIESNYRQGNLNEHDLIIIKTQIAWLQNHH